MLIVLNSVDPGSPATARLRVWPPAIRLQGTAQADDPRGDLDINERDLSAQKERALRICGADQCVECISELLRVGYLLMCVLLLKDTVEIWDDVAVDLRMSEVKGTIIMGCIQNPSTVGNAPSAWRLRAEATVCRHSDPPTRAMLGLDQVGSVGQG